MTDTPSLADIERLAAQAFAELPEAVRAGCEGLAIRVVERADADTLVMMEMDDPEDLTGLYEGIPITEKSVTDPAPYQDIVWLYRRAIIAEWHERGNVTLEELVTHVLVHEIAHHLGWSDEDIAAVDRWWE